MELNGEGDSFTIWPNKSTKPNQIINNNNLCENVTAHLRKQTTVIKQLQYVMNPKNTFPDSFAKTIQSAGSFAIYSSQMNIEFQLNIIHK